MDPSMIGSTALANGKRDDTRDIRRSALRALQRRHGGVIRGAKLFPLRLQPQPTAPMLTLDLALGWYAVHTEPLMESHVAQGLKEAGFQAFLPTFTRYVKHARRVKERKLALFPRYVFVGFNASSQCWGPINGIKGVMRLLEVDERPLRIPDRLIGTLMVDDLLKAHDVVEVAGQAKEDPTRKRVARNAKSWKGRKERVRLREQRKRAKGMAEWLVVNAGDLTLAKSLRA